MHLNGLFSLTLQKYRFQQRKKSLDRSTNINKSAFKFEDCCESHNPENSMEYLRSEDLFVSMRQ